MNQGTRDSCGEDGGVGMRASWRRRRGLADFLRARELNFAGMGNCRRERFSATIVDDLGTMGKRLSIASYFCGNRPSRFLQTRTFSLFCLSLPRRTNRVRGWFYRQLSQTIVHALTRIIGGMCKPVKVVPIVVSTFVTRQPATSKADPDRILL